MTTHHRSDFAESVAAALAVMGAHIEALNAGDEQAIAATLHFPHHRLSDGQLKTWQNSDSYFADFQDRAGTQWHSSRWGRLDVVQASEDKVHLDVLVERFDKHGNLLIRFDSLWVIACVNGRWAAQLRSSFAPDARIRAGEQVA